MVLNCLNKIFLFTGVFSLAANFLAILEILVPIHVFKKKEIFASVKTQWKLFPSKNNRSFLLNYKTKKKKQTLNILFCFDGIFSIFNGTINSFLLFGTKTLNMFSTTAPLYHAMYCINIATIFFCFEIDVPLHRKPELFSYGPEHKRVPSISTNTTKSNNNFKFLCTNISYFCILLY